jgi:hypothetical protein
LWEMRAGPVAGDDGYAVYGIGAYTMRAKPCGAA